MTYENIENLISLTVICIAGLMVLRWLLSD